MHVTGQHLFQTTPAQIAKALTDPQALARCIPKCTGLSGSLSEGFAYELHHKVGPVPINLKGNILVREEKPDDHYIVSITGSNKITGTLECTVALVLEAAEAGTELSYTMESDSTVVEKLFGQKRISHFVQTGIRHFMDRLESHILFEPV